MKIALQPTTILFALLNIFFALSSHAQNALTVQVVDGQHRQQLYFNGDDLTIQFCGLIPGQTYQVWAVQTETCQPAIRIVGQAEGAATFEFEADTECMDFLFEKGDGDIGCSEKYWASIGCTSCGKKENGFLEKLANLGVIGGFSAQSLIQDIFIGGGCFDVMNVIEIGSPQGKGQFVNGSSSIAIDDGVILSSGDINNAPGPNNSNSAGNSMTGGGSDPDLSQIATSGLFDVTGVEFDFQPTINTINFEYVFASEEYCEFVNSTFNDVFGFFISGPGISGGFSSNGQNIAVIPGTGIYVAINNVNHLSNSSYFVPNQSNCNGTTNMNDIQFDGYTTILTATANVIPCETYHIRLVVADVGDAIYDSAVFLRANSFVAGGTGTAEASSLTTGTNVVYENCNDGTVTFFRSGGDINVPLVIDFQILPSSTATSGVDYVPLPTTIVIPAGQDQFTLPITVFDDGIIEGTETIVMSLTNSCSCSSLEFEIQIEDPPEITVDMPDQEICSGIPVILEPTVDGGIPGSFFSYQWSTGDTDPILIDSPLESTTYQVTVSDVCGGTAEAEANVDVAEVPTAILEGIGFLCTSDPTATVDLTITFTGTAPWVFEYTINGVPQGPITTDQNPYIITTNVPGTYELESVTSVVGNCEGAAIGFAPVELITIDATATPTPATCAGDGSITVEASGGIEPYSYTWSNGFPPMFNTAIGLGAGTYYVTVTDINGCVDSTSATVTAGPPMEVSALPPPLVTCTSQTSSIQLEIDGGTAPYGYTWTGGIGNTGNPTGLSSGTYWVTVEDDVGCIDSTSVTIDENTTPPDAGASTVDVLTCTVNTATVLGSGSSTGPGISYQWSGPGITGSTTTIDTEVNAPGVYTIVVTDASNGCTEDAQVEVEIDQDPPAAVANGNELTCVVLEVGIDGNGSSTGTDFEYSWSGPGVVSGGNTLTPTVNAAGTYTLVVTNLANGCTEDALAVVTMDDDSPTAVIATPLPIDCNTTILTLDGSGSSSGTNFTYEWLENGTLIPGENSSTLDVTQVGTYEIVVTNMDNGCTQSFPMDVEENMAEPEVTASANDVLTCVVTSVGLTATVANGPAGFDFAWDTADGIIDSGGNTPNPTVSAPGIYTVTVTDQSNGCTSDESVEVILDAVIPDVDVVPGDDLDCNNLESLLDGSASSTGPNLDITWTTVGGNFAAGQNTLTPTVDAPGTYTLTIFDNSNSCENSVTVTIDEDVAAPDVSLPTLPQLDCDVESITIDGEVSNFPSTDLNFEWTTPNGVIDAGANDISALVSTPGTYTLMVTNQNNGCTGTAAITIDQDITPPTVAVADPDVITCANNSVGLNGAGSSTGSNFDYTWTGPGIVSGATTLTPVVNAGGTYVLEIINTANGCTESQQIVVDENVDLPSVDAGAPVTLTCADPQLNLGGIASSGPEFEYQWTGPGIVSGGTTLTPAIDEPGTYTLLVTNVTNECFATAQVDIPQDIAEPMAEAGQGGQLSCTLTQMGLDGTGSSTGDVTYGWTSPDGNFVSGENTLTPQINAPGTYIIEVTNNSNGCTATDNVLVEEDDDLPDVNVASAAPLTCDVLEVDLDGTGSVQGADFTYEWSTVDGNFVGGQTTLNPTVDAPGVYVLTVTNNATNCTNIGSVTVDALTDPPAAEAGPMDELTCTELSLDLDGAGSAIGSDYTYLWTTQDGNIVANETTLAPAVDEPGTYQILVTNTLTGCTSTDEVTITEDLNAPVAVAATPGPLTCVVESLTLIGTGSSTGNEYTYDWTTIDGNIVNGANSLNPLIDEPGTYQLEVSNLINGCTETFEITVDEDVASPTANAGTADLLSCTTSSLNLDGSGSSTGGIFEYEWSTVTGNIVSGNSSLTPIIDQVGTYTLLVTNTENGCTSTDEVVVDQDDSLPVAAISPPAQLTCILTETNLSATASQGAIFEYEWSTSDGNFTGGQNTLTPGIDEPGTYLLTVTNTDNGCTNQVQVTVDEDVVAPSANAGTAFVLDCFDPVDYLDGSGSYGSMAVSFLWETTDGSIVSGETTPSPGITQAGTYQLTVTDLGNGCTDIDNVVVTSDGPTAEPLPTQPACFGDLGAIIIADVTGGVTPYRYSIDGGDTYGSQTVHTNLEPGVYEIVVQDANGCDHHRDVVIHQPNLFDIEVESLVQMNLGESYQIQTLVNVPVSEIDQVTWYPSIGLSCDDCLNPVVTPTATMLYQVSVLTKDGCEDDATIMLQVNKQGGVYVPSAFSPNGDGTNDIFMIHSDPKSVVEIKSFLVFSRWGETVYEYYNFQPNNPAFGWDGHHRGTPLNPGVFVWFAQVEFIDGRIELFEGNVHLMK